MKCEKPKTNLIKVCNIVNNIDRNIHKDAVL